MARSSPHCLVCGRSRGKAWLAGSVLLALAGGAIGLAVAKPHGAAPATDDEGEAIFRFDTFGDEQLWTDRLRMHEVIESALDPLTALQVGLKVDADALPDALIADLLEGKVDLT